MFATLLLSARPAFCVALGLVLVFAKPDAIAAQELTLEEVQRLAETAQPRLEARRSAIEAASEFAATARELPDPKLKLGLLNVPIEGEQALSLSSEPMTMATVGVMQELPRQAKRTLRSEIFQLSGARSTSELTALRLQMRRDAALTWLDAWFSARALELIARQLSEAQIEIDALAIALRNNRADAAEVSAARIALELLRDREQAQIGSMGAARAMLSRWVGERASAPLTGLLPVLPQPEDPEELVRTVEMHPLLDVAEVRARIAETEARLASLDSRPDWSVEVAYARRASEFGDMVSMQFQVDLPILQARRQNRAVAARVAEARQARELREDDLRAMRAAALQLHAQWRMSVARAELFAQRVLPEARNSLQAATASYRSGKGRLADVLAARRTLLDLELEALTRRVDVARSAVELDYFSAKGA